MKREVNRCRAGRFGLLLLCPRFRASTVAADPRRSRVLRKPSYSGLAMDNTSKGEWSRYYRFDESNSIEALHARFVAHRYARHAHDYFVVGLVESGVQSYWYRGARHLTPSGRVFVVNPGEPHTGEAATSEGYVYRTLYPHADLLARMSEDVGARTKVPFLKGAVLHDPLLATLLSRFHRVLAEQAPRVERESLLLEALTRLITRHADPQVTLSRVGKERPAVRKAREYIAANFANELSLFTLSEMVSLSPHYFARAFESQTGLPPHVYLEGVRIQKAREFLDRGEAIASAALSVGYSDQSHLTRRFKRFLGITPGQYLRERKTRQVVRHGNMTS
jgi:AraC-like DNA-binding protein